MVYSQTQNNNTIWFCSGLLSQDKRVPINQADCESAKGTWVSYNKGINSPPVDCRQVGWSRDNHLGNSRDGQPLTYNWTLPLVSDLLAQGAALYDTTNRLVRCVARIRYNISTDDYNPWNTNATSDDDPWNGISSPVTQNPTININVFTTGLKLAVNTAQFGRTFQDRSHVFYIAERPSSLKTLQSSSGSWIYNLGVRGKRGNIVQTYPAVEYDFVSNRLHVSTNQWIHIQWTGSNTHNNGDPAGDGQAGDAGEGTDGTDRSNFVIIDDLSHNYPIPLDKYPTNPWNYTFECYHPPLGVNTMTKLSGTDAALIAATSGQVYDASALPSDFDPLLNDAPASLVRGLLCQIKPKTGSWSTIYYTCTRNNNFSNRSQKGTLIIN